MDTLYSKPTCPTHPLLVLLNSAFFFLAPLLFLYNAAEEDFTSTQSRALTITTATVGGLVIYAARDFAFVYNTIVAFHFGLEVFIVDNAFQYAQEPDGSAWAGVGATVVILHLLPFLFVPLPKLWVLLAYVGLLVNTLLILMAMSALGPRLLLLVGASSGALLAVSVKCLGEREPPAICVVLRELYK